jgi:hypothetical protein
MLNYFAQTYNSYSSSTYDYQAGNEKAFSMLIIISILFWLVIYIYAAICMWKIFTKAGQPGWKAVVPGYNSWVYAEVAGRPGWWGIVPFGSYIPLVGFIFGIAGIVLYVLIALDLAKKFGKDNAFAILGLVIFSFVGIGILAFGSAKYQAGSVQAGAQPPAPTSPNPPVPPVAPTPPAAPPTPPTSPTPPAPTQAA